MADPPDDPSAPRVGPSVYGVPSDDANPAMCPFRTYPDKGFVFRDDLRTTLDSRCHELHDGLYEYLAIGGVAANFDCNAATWRLTDGVLDKGKETAILAKFSGGSGTTEWNDLRTKMHAVLTGGPLIDFREMDDADAQKLSRLGYAKITARVVYLNPRDATKLTYTAPTITPSFDGFWMILHEIVHITHGILDDAGSDSTPGVVEAKLNPVRAAFSLPLRTSYYNPKPRPPGIQFAGGEVLWP